MRILVALTLLLSAGCGSGAPGSAATNHSPAPARTTTSAPSQPTFQSSVSVIDAALRARMRWSWRPGCPVPLEALRHVTASYVGFDGKTHRGHLVVHRAVASDVVAVLRRLYVARFPIHRMESVDEYRGDDGRSMAADNSSGFNCREVTGSPGVWSQHSYGRALDINPVENPYLSGESVQPAAGAHYVDRAAAKRGMIRHGGVVVRAFASVGWEWGGAWAESKDYQHFSENGR